MVKDTRYSHKYPETINALLAHSKILEIYIDGIKMHDQLMYSYSTVVCIRFKIR